MQLSNHSAVPVYTISGSSTARPLPEWLARKRKRSLKNDPEYANRIELLQDFEFEEASQCIRVSEDGQWVMSTGTYKPQIHTHYLPHLSLSFARHTTSLNATFILLSSDYSKSLHLQADRTIEFHTPEGCYYTTRIPRYGRDLKYDRISAEALIPSVGVNENGLGEVYRLNLELGRFMRAYEVDVGGDDMVSLGGGALQGGIGTGSVNTAAIAEESHNLLAFGTSLGSVEFWDPRSRNRVGILQASASADHIDGRQEVTALQFHRSGLSLAVGTSMGLIQLYDLRSPIPTLKKDQGYGFPIQNLLFLSPPNISEPKILSADKRILKLWDERTGAPWTSVEPAVDMHDVAWCPDSGMLLTANEGRQQHAFFIPQLGPAPKWCSFLDNLVEEMAEDPNDPNAFASNQRAGEVYDNYKFLTHEQLEQLNLSHLIGTTSLLRPYMHGFFVDQRLYEEAKLIADPFIYEEQRAKRMREKIEKERESRIRGAKKVVKTKVNQRLAEKLLEREEKNDRRRAKRLLDKTGVTDGDDKIMDAKSETDLPPTQDPVQTEESRKEDDPAPRASAKNLMTDPRFARLFEDESFAIDETSREFQSLNASTVPNADGTARGPRRLTAAEEEDLENLNGKSSSKESSEDDEDEKEENGRAPKSDRRKTDSSKSDNQRISSTSYHKSGHERQEPRMQVSSSSSRRPSHAAKGARDLSFGERTANNGRSGSGGRPREARVGNVVGEKEITFAPRSGRKESGGRIGAGGDGGRRNGGGTADGGGSRAGAAGRGTGRRRDDGRRSASGNVFRQQR